MAKKRIKLAAAVWKPKVKAEVVRFGRIRAGLATAAVQQDQEFQPETYLLSASPQEPSRANDDLNAAAVVWVLDRASPE